MISKCSPNNSPLKDATFQRFHSVPKRPKRRIPSNQPYTPNRTPLVANRPTIHLVSLLSILHGFVDAQSDRGSSNNDDDGQRNLQRDTDTLLLHDFLLEKLSWRPHARVVDSFDRESMLIAIRIDLCQGTRGTGLDGDEDLIISARLLDCNMFAWCQELVWLLRRVGGIDRIGVSLCWLGSCKCRRCVKRRAASFLFFGYRCAWRCIVEAR